MKLISDIRLFESSVPNIDGNPSPHYIGKLHQYESLDCLDVIERLLFLLRYRGFGFDGFDHLYLNFTPCIPSGEVQDVNRYNIREFSWYHFVDAGCKPDTFNKLSLEEKNRFVLNSIKKAILLKAADESKKLFEDTFNEVIDKGALLLIPYRRKESTDHTVEIFTRIDDEVSFFPLIRVTDKNGIIKAEQQLRPYGRDEFISQISTISIGKTSVRIMPRKNFYSDYFDLTPIKIKW